MVREDRPARRLLVKLLSGRTRHAIRLAQARFAHLYRHANISRWVSGAVSFRSSKGQQYQVSWKGLDEGLSWLTLLLGGEQHSGEDAPQTGPTARGSRVLLPGAWRVPIYIDAVMDLARPVEETYATGPRTVRTIIRRNLAACRYETVASREHALAISHAMLRPYAESRHGASAVQLADEEVVAFALGRAGGSLKVLVRDGHEVACQLGFACEPFGVKTWEASRFGYVPSVFNDPVALDEVNTLNAYLAAVDARERGFAQLNYGMSVARPDGGLLHWKCRRGCVPEPRSVTTYVALSVPLAQRAEFFAARPLFFVEDDALNLAIGWPAGMATAELQELLRRNHVRGIRRVRVYRSGAQHEDGRSLADWITARDAGCRIEYEDAASGPG